MNTTPISSCYGRRVIEWERPTLETLLSQLRSERLAHDTSVETESGEAEHNALMAEAEQIKRATENKIREVEDSA